MKRLVLLFCALLLALLAACRPEPEGGQMEEEPLHLESLSVEVPRSGLSAQDLARTVRELPEALKAALASQGAEVGAVTVSVGSSPSATAQAVAEGGVDLAFLPAADYAALKNPPELILAAGPAAPVLGKDPSAWSGEATGEPLLPGAPALLCAAPTESGAALANKAGDLTWEDLSIRWGAVEDESLQAVGLWLRDRYGETAAHVAQSTYESYEDLLRAAAAGEIDLLPLRDDVRREWAEAWPLDASKTDSRGVPGLGRPAPLWEELPVLAVTERLYTMAAVVRPEGETLADERFSKALAAAVNGMLEEHPVFGPYAYGPAEDSALDLQRRLSGLG